jgi:hypothetical protein
MPAAIGGAGTMLPPSQKSASYVDVTDPANWPAGVVYGNPTNQPVPPHDDAAAIQAIINANPGKPIYLPRTYTGTAAVPSYYLTKTLTLRSNGQILRGDGSAGGGTVLQFAPGVTGVVLAASSSGVEDISLYGSEPWIGATDYTQAIVPAARDPGVTRSAGASDADGIRVMPSGCVVRNVYVYGFGRDGINASNVDLDVAPPAGADDSYFDNNFLANNRGNGCRVQGGDGNVIQSNATQYFVN